MLCGNINKVEAYKITQEQEQSVSLGIEDFLVQNDEIALIKYGKILQSVIKASQIS